MRFYYDLGLSKLVSRPGFNGALDKVEFKRGDSALIEVAFSRDGEAAVLTGTVTEMVFVVKQTFLELAPALLVANEWTFTDGIYSAPLLATADLAPLLANLSFVDLKAEFTFTTSLMGTASSQTLGSRINNDLWKGTEGTGLAVLDPDAWLAIRLAALAPLELTAPPVQGVQRCATAPVDVDDATAGISLVIEGVSYTFVNGAADAAGEVANNGDVFDYTVSTANLVDEINGDGIGPAHPLVTAVVDPTNSYRFRLKAILPGAAGNAIDLSAPTGGFTGLPATLTGGVTGITGTFGFLGQEAITTLAVNGLQYSFRCVCVDPMIWEPGTSGMLYNATLGEWRIARLTGTDLEPNLVYHPLTLVEF